MTNIRKELIMTNNKRALFCWNYFCTLCDMLKNTMQFLDHSNDVKVNIKMLEKLKIKM